MKESNLPPTVVSSLGWLRRSIDVNQGRGSSLSYSLMRRPWAPWFPPYPETTGYIIETLFNYSSVQGQEFLRSYAFNCADWLVEIQSSEGGYQGTVNGKKDLSVFNTGMILFGLLRAYRESNDTTYLESAERAVHWLLEVLDGEEGNWKRNNYVKDYSPTYYSRVVWAILQYAMVTHDDHIETLCGRVLDHLKSRYVNETNQYSGWSFYPDKKASTHTIAYTLRGFAECASILNDRELLNNVQTILQLLKRDIEQHHSMAGAYDQRWRRDQSFRCLTGEGQMAYLFLKFAPIGEDDFIDTGIRLITAVRNKVRKRRISKALQGAIPGSDPYFGKYMPFHHPNWAVKFYLDAELLWHKKKAI